MPLVRQAGGGALRLYRNRYPDVGNSLVVTLLGSGKNKLALGAPTTFESGGRTQIREVFPHNTHRSQTQLRQHFGIGPVYMIDRLTVRWPSGRTTTRQNLPSGRAILGREDGGTEGR